MGSYLIRRLRQALLSVFGAITIVFVIVRVVSGDPVELMLGAGATDSQIADLRTELGMTRSIPAQYLSYLGDVATGDFGTSWRYGGDALSNTFDRLPSTLQLASSAMLVTIVIGFPAGVFAARRAGRTGDRLVSGLSVLGQGLPSFWVGIVLILVLARQLNLFPSTADGTMKSLVLPSFTLALPFLGWMTRLVRNGAIEELGKDYVQTARSKGLLPRRIFYVHVLRNIMIPVVTVLGLLMGNFIANAVIIETVFSWPGIGMMLVDSITNRDYSVVQAAVAVITAGYIVINLIVDLLYFYLDPRIDAENA